MIERFLRREEDYRRWLRTKASGYVLNCEPNPKASYLMLHRATCRTISGTPPRGSTWTETYMKVCADSTADLDQWANANTGGFPKRCTVCQP
jgi:hypothetical protein